MPGHEEDVARLPGNLTDRSAEQQLVQAPGPEGQAGKLADQPDRAGSVMAPHQMGGAPSGRQYTGELPLQANQPPQHLKALPRQPNGPNALDMLLSHVDDGLQDEPELTDDLWYPTRGGVMVGPGDSLDSNPDQEGPAGTVHDPTEPGA